MNYGRLITILTTLSLLLNACSPTAPLAIFKKLSPHDAYGQRLKDAGLDRTAMGGAWLQTANQAPVKALSITVPYKETGYFAADKIQSSVLRFDAKRGQKLHIALSKQPEFNFDIYVDIFQEQPGGTPKLAASADTSGLRLDYEVPKSGSYLLRLQPELLRGGEFTLTITAGPSLSFPVSASGRPHIGSFWGDNRDEGGRRHEGIDIFATKHTPAIAAADGIITRVTTNKLGGKVVFMRPEGRDYNTYYAHLDSQLVRDGQTVRTGDTLGLVGNTGNARYTPSHLHFGIYTANGAVDPLPFVNREIKVPAPITASEKLLNATARTTDNNVRLLSSPAENATTVTTLPLHTALQVESATQNWYKVTLPDGRSGYLLSKAIAAAYPLRRQELKTRQPLYDAPDTTAARKLSIPSGSKVSILAGFKNFYLVSDAQDNTGWIEVK
jgi:murein DD-endopeptidase MepM/ murein hydrolase activator NlpD/SH3-like domain-containing protein